MPCTEQDIGLDDLQGLFQLSYSIAPSCTHCIGSELTFAWAFLKQPVQKKLPMKLQGGSHQSTLVVRNCLIFTKQRLSALVIPAQQICDAWNKAWFKPLIAQVVPAEFSEHLLISHTPERQLISLWHTSMSLLFPDF